MLTLARGATSTSCEMGAHADCANRLGQACDLWCDCACHRRRTPAAFLFVDEGVPARRIDLRGAA